MSIAIFKRLELTKVGCINFLDAAAADDDYNEMEWS